MIRPATAVVTIAVLLACPLICLGHVPGEQSVPLSRCCPHCPPPAQEAEEEAPASPLPSCCLCKGAITDRATVDWQPEKQATAAVVEPHAGQTTLRGAATEGPRLRESPAPHSGRRLRLEHCALTC